MKRIDMFQWYSTFLFYIYKDTVPTTIYTHTYR